MKSFRKFISEAEKEWSADTGKVYLDMDGVLVDFIDGVLRWYKKDRKNRTVTKEFEAMAREVTEKSSAGKMKGFWENLPLMPGAKRLVKWVQGRTSKADTWILSSCSGDLKYCAKEKFKWMKKHIPMIPEENIILVMSAKHKARYAKEGDALVDDFKPNIQRWTQAGGIGIYHKGDVNKTIKELDRVL